MRRNQIIMGTGVSLDIPEAKNEGTFDDVFELLRQIDVRFSPYKKDSELSGYQRGEIIQKNLSPQMKTVMAGCKKFEKLTNGYFSAYYHTPISHLDAVQGSKEERASRMNQYGEQATDAADAAMRQKPAGATSSAGRQGQAVRNRWFDPTGYVKGWAIAEAGKLIEKQGYKTFCIGIGGDILARSGGSKEWQIGIQDPTDKSKILNTLSISNGAVATSGNYERGAHIINPKTGQPADELLSVTVIGPDIIKADVLATAAFAMGKAGVKFVNRQKGYECLAIDKNGASFFSSEMKNLIK